MMPRTLSIVKFKNPKCNEAAMYDFNETDRFVYLGLVAQDNTRCLVQSIHNGRISGYLSPSLFEEVDPIDY